MYPWILLADLHFGNCPLQEYTETLQWIHQQLDQHQPRHIIILGDSLHTRGSVNVETQQDLDVFLRSLQTKPYKPYIHILIGNHDMSNRYTRNVNSLSVFHRPEELRTHVYWEITATTLDEQPCVFIPYHEDQKEIATYLQTSPDVPGSIAFCHVALNGARINGMNNSTNQICKNTNLSVNDFSRCRMAFSGHFHHHATHGSKFAYVGSPMMFSFGDVGSPHRGCVAYDPISGDWNLLENPFAERFLDMDVSTAMEASKSVSGKHIRLICDSDLDLEPAKHRLQELGARNVFVKAATERVAIDHNMTTVTQFDIQTLMAEFLKKQGKGDNIELQDYFTKMLDKVDPYRSRVAFDGTIDRVELMDFMGILGKRVFHFSALKPGLWLFFGNNGAGKTTISDAIMYALFGHTSRGKADAGIINNKAQKCTVTVVFKNGTIVTRTKKMKGTDLFFVTPDGTKVQKSTLEFTQGELHRHMNIRLPVFKRVAVLNSHEIHKFFSGNDRSKGEPVEEIIGLHILEDLAKAVKEQCKTSITQRDGTYRDLEAAKKDVDANKSVDKTFSAQLIDLETRYSKLVEEEVELCNTIAQETDRVNALKRTKEAELEEIKTQMVALSAQEHEQLSQLSAEIAKLPDETLVPPQDEKLRSLESELSKLKQSKMEAEARENSIKQLKANLEDYRIRERKLDDDITQIRSIIRDGTEKRNTLYKEKQTQLRDAEAKLHHETSSGEQRLRYLQETLNTAASEVKKIGDINTLTTKLGHKTSALSEKMTHQARHEKQKADLIELERRCAALRKEEEVLVEAAEQESTRENQRKQARESELAIIDQQLADARRKVTAEREKIRLGMADTTKMIEKLTDEAYVKPVQAKLDKISTKYEERLKWKSAMDAALLRQEKATAALDKLERDTVIGKVIRDSREMAVSFGNPFLIAGIKRTVEDPLSSWQAKVQGETAEFKALNETVAKERIHISNLRKRSWTDDDDDEEGLFKRKKALEDEMGQLQAKRRTELEDYQQQMKQFQIQSTILNSSHSAFEEEMTKKRRALQTETASDITKMNQALNRCQAQLVEVSGARQIALKSINAFDEVNEKRQMEQLRADIAQLEGAINRQKVETRELQHRVEELQNQKNALHATIRHTESGLRKVLDSIKSELAILDRNLENEKHEKELIRHEIQMEQVVKSIQSSALNLQTLESKSMNSHSLKPRIREIDTEIQTLSADRCTWIQDMEQKRSQLRSLQNQVANLKSEFRKQERHLETQKANLEVSLATLSRPTDLMTQKQLALTQCQTQKVLLHGLQAEKRHALDVNRVEQTRKIGLLDSLQKSYDTLCDNLNTIAFWDTHLDNSTQKKGQFREFCVDRYIQMLNVMFANNLRYINEESIKDLSCRVDNKLRLIATGNGINFSQRSSGESKRTILALLFALMDCSHHNSLFQNRVLFIDEIYDNSLDASGQAVVKRWIAEFSLRNPKVQIFVISHVFEQADIDPSVGVIRVNADGLSGSKVDAICHGIGKVRFSV